MISSKPLRIAACILLAILWAATVLADVIIVDDHVIGFSILISVTVFFIVIGRKLCKRDVPLAGTENPDGKFWVQYADGSYLTLQDQTAAGISSTLRTFRWDLELAKYRQPGKNGVPPGLGLGHFGDAHFVHVTFTSASGCDVLYVRGNQPAAEQVYRQNLPSDTVGKIIAAYMLGDTQKLLALLS